jgi:hypothetical protein
MSDQVQVEVVDQNTGEKHIITDLLVNMFIQQVQHAGEYDKILRAKGIIPLSEALWGNLSHPDTQAKLREFAGYITEELYEGINLLKNKPWKQTYKETDHDEFYKEMGDFWHFVLEFMMYAGMMPDQIQKYYFGMAQKNIERRAEGY